MMELKDLVGKHFLDACDFTNEMVKSWGDEFEQSDVCRFRLDGVIYVAAEDPSDGYRSSMRELAIDEEFKMNNRFEAVQVVGIYVDKSGYDSADILKLVDVETGKTVLEVGTDSTDDYYPTYVANFDPTAMATNA